MTNNVQKVTIVDNEGDLGMEQNGEVLNLFLMILIS